LIETYRGTDYEFVPIHFPPATKECIDNLVSLDERCSADYAVQVGSPEGACDVGAVSNAMLSNVAQCDDTKDGTCSPAYEALKNYEISKLDIQQFYQYRDEDSNRDMRQAVCRWFGENLNTIKDTVVPRTYPRQPWDISFYQPLVVGSIVVASLAVICVMICAFSTKYFEKTKPMVSTSKHSPLFELENFHLLFIYLNTEIRPSRLLAYDSWWAIPCCCGSYP